MSYSLRISEIFHSLQGESTFSGLPTVFVRLTGCPLRCGYCDTSYAFRGGQSMQREQILQRVAAFDARYVCVTGGEPLAQKNCLPLLTDLCDAGYRVSLETSGAMAIDEVDERVVRVMDLKTPASGEVEKNLYSNLPLLRNEDQLKFVICNEDDYHWACQQISQHNLQDGCEILFSPAEGLLEPAALADWIVRDRLNVRFQLQLHKILWGGGEGR